MMNIGTRFEALRNHTALVVTISEEKLIHEANLKLIMARVNAATSLLKWAKGEGNPALHDTVEKLYDIALMWSTVQKQFAEQCFTFSKSLNEILQVEQGLDAIRKQHQISKEEMEKLQKLAESFKKKSDIAKINEIEEEIIKRSSEEEELAAELQVKFVKGEIFKAKVIKGALLHLMDTYKENSVKVNSLCDASKTVIECLPDVPRHLTTENQYQKNQHTTEVVTQLAKNLGLEQAVSSIQSRPLSEILPAVASPPPSPTQNRKEIKQQNDKKKKKRNSKLPSPLSSNFPIAKLMKQRNKVKRSVSDDNHHVQLSSSPPPQLPRPNKPPPALPMEFRARSQSSNTRREPPMHSKIKKPISRAPIVLGTAATANDSDDDDDDNYEEPGYITPNFFPRSVLVRCASDSTLSSSTKDDYTEPLDRYESIWDDFERAGTLSDHLYDTPYDCSPKEADVPHVGPPPKPKRSAPETAVYINTEDVEMLLHEFYQDSSVKDQVKPAVKQRVFTKIAEERRSSNAVGVDDNIDISVHDSDTDAVEKPVEEVRNDSDSKDRVKPEIKRRVFKKSVEEKSDANAVIEDKHTCDATSKTVDSSDDADFRSPGHGIMRKPEKRIRSKVGTQDRDLGVVDNVIEDMVENDPQSRGTGVGARSCSGSNLQRGKHPPLPIRQPERCEHSDIGDCRHSSVESPPPCEMVSPTGSNVKDLASMLQSRVPVPKNVKPHVPPRPSLSP